MDRQSDEETASTVSDVGCSDSEESWCSSLSEAGPEVLDPVLSVPVPQGRVPESVLAAAHQAHLSSATSAFDVLTAPPPPPDEVVRCVERMVSAGPAATLAKRRSFLSALKAASSRLAPVSERLLSAAPAHVRAVNPRSHPALLQWCLDQCPSCDPTLLDHLINGFPLVGDIPIDPRARAKVVRRMLLTPQELRSQASHIAGRSIFKHSSQPPSEHDVEVMRQTVAEARAHRMLMPCIIEGTSLSYLLTRRFPVEQLDSKGKLKLRMIDDLADSRVNDACRIGRQIRMGRITDLSWCVDRLGSCTPDPLVLSKSDFASAYRHCPIRSEDLDLAHILLRDGSGRLLRSQQFAMPFGAVAAVYAWDRLGSAISSILLELMDLPVNRYVDDLFWVDYQAIAQESRSIVLEVVSLLGLQLAVDKTPAPAASQEVLGVSCTLRPHASGCSVALAPEARKLQLWLQEITVSLESSSPDLKQLSRLVGRLSFAAWAIWGPVARSRLRAAYSFILSGSSLHRDQMVKDLAWWVQLLKDPLPAVASSSSVRQAPSVVYTDAEGSSGLGAVLHQPDRTVWFQDKVPCSLTGSLAPRRTQIFAFEVIAVWSAVCRFSSQLSGKHVVFFIDNKAALYSLIKGSSKSPDVHLLVRSIWDRLRLFDIKPVFKWVPSKLNLADLPSRGKPPVLGSKIPARVSYQPLVDVLRSAQ